MFYRRKILLALLEAFGGFLTNTDCQKLLFLFCLRRGKNYYDFFPHKYGNFSLLVVQDKARLDDLGFLTSHSDFQLKDSQPYSNQLEAMDRTTLCTLVSEIGTLRGESLIQKVYLEAPHYVSRSQIATRILTQSEYEQVSHSWNNDQTACLFTLGYEGLSIDAYLDVLISNNIRVLVDVRKNPISMKYGFSKTKLSHYAKIAGITYVHIPDLGIPSDLRQDLNSTVAYQKLFNFYFSEMLPNCGEALASLKRIVSDTRRVAITCFEADYHFCHRHKVIEYFEDDPCFKTPVIHLYKDSICKVVNRNQYAQD